MNIVTLKRIDCGKAVISEVPDKINLRAGALVRAKAGTSDKPFLGVCLCDSFKATDEVIATIYDAFKTKGTPSSQSRVIGEYAYYGYPQATDVSTDETKEDPIAILGRLQMFYNDRKVIVETSRGTADFFLHEANIYEGVGGELVFDAE